MLASILKVNKNKEAVVVLMLLSVLCLAGAGVVFWSLKKKPDGCPHQGSRECSGNCGQCNLTRDDTQLSV